MAHLQEWKLERFRTMVHLKGLLESTLIPVVMASRIIMTSGIMQ